MVGIVIVGKSGVEFAGVVEDLEGKVEILLAGYHGDEAFGKEAVGPGFDWGSDGVGLEVWGLGGVDGGECAEMDGGDLHKVAVSVT